MEKTKSLVAPAKLTSQRSSKRFSDSSEKRSANVNFNPPKPNPDCRVCCHMKEVLNVRPQPNTVFFENHLSNYVTGCPQFILMDMTERFKVITDIQMCNRCFHPDVTFTRDHIKDCKARSDKNSPFSCSKCKLHSWLCKYHKAENQSKLDKFKKDYREKFKLKLVFTASTSPIQDPVLEGVPSPPSTVEIEDAVSSLGSAADSTTVSPTAASQTCTNNKSLSAASKIMRKRFRSNGFKGDIRPVPQGESMFLFFRAKGKVNGVNTFFDKGCSTAVFKEGIPEKELRGRIIQKGPFIMSGVGGIETKANNMWLTSLDLADGCKQLVQGLSVDTVTMDFPVINLEAAVNEVKADNPDDSILQSCMVPSMAGGCTDLLLGIMYAAIHPVLVHQLPSGLAIYKSVLASHDGYDCLIGGPHKSFDAYAGHVGGASKLLAHFAQGLQQFRSFGVPKLEQFPTTIEEEQFAKKLNNLEGDMPEFETVCQLDDLDNMLDDVFVDSEDQSSVHELPVVNTSCLCTEMPYCCKNLSNMIGIFETSSADKLSLLRNLIFAQEGGLSIEYRCVKCRDCWQCKNADVTEKLSLREEQENALIQQSVKLDFNEKSIICSLPGRGDEREFLASNRDQALKVYQSVCKRYGGDQNAKDLILGSFRKLFEKGFVQLVAELTENERNQFLSKEVQMYIPWRPVFSDSISTP